MMDYMTLGQPPKRSPKSSKPTVSASHSTGTEILDELHEALRYGASNQVRHILGELGGLGYGVRELDDLGVLTLVPLGGGEGTV
jgi:hypothetical protein